MDNRQLYDSITQAWQYMLGKNFHWGYFKNSNESLDKASENLIELMLSFITIDENTKLLDIGCGIGTPAFYINNKFNCSIIGISNSQKGIEEANKIAANKGLSEKVSFFERDALNNGFEKSSFDIAWLMEMSHLIENKELLISESLRSIKSGGQIVLCDLMFCKALTAKEIVANKDSLIKLSQSFGQARIETFDYYKSIFEKHHLKNIKIQDISDDVTLTLNFWKKNVANNYNIINNFISKEEIDNFLFSCDFLKEFYERKTWGYGVIYAEK